MSVQCDIAQHVIKKHALLAELETCRAQIKRMCQFPDVELPFAVEVDGQAVTVSRPSYEGAQPLTKVLPLHKGCTP